MYGYVATTLADRVRQSSGGVQKLESAGTWRWKRKKSFCRWSTGSYWWCFSWAGHILPPMLFWIRATWRSKYIIIIFYLSLLKHIREYFHPTSPYLQEIVVSMTGTYEFLLIQSSLVSTDCPKAIWSVLIWVFNQLPFSSSRQLNVRSYKHKYSSFLRIFQKSSLKVL